MSSGSNVMSGSGAAGSYSVQTGTVVTINTTQKAAFYKGVVDAVTEILAPFNPNLQAQDMTEAINSSQGTVLTVSFGPIKKFPDTVSDELKARLGNLGLSYSLDESPTGSRDLKVGVDMSKGLRVALQLQAHRGVRDKSKTRGCALLMFMIIVFIAVIWMMVPFSQKIQFVHDWAPWMNTYMSRFAQKFNVEA